MSILRIVAALYCFLFLSVPALKAQGEVIRDPKGAFSLPLPSGWRLADYPASKFKVGVAASPVDGFTPNVNVVEVSSVLGLADYVSANLQGMKEMAEKGDTFADFRLLKQAVVSTKSGVKVTRMVCLLTLTANGMHLRNQVYFVAGKGDTKYIITYSIPESQGNKYDAMVIASMTGFALE